jgi:RNA polymerase sigma-70 factor, ECF subfamily
MTLFADSRALLMAFRAGESGALARVYWFFVDDVERWVRRFGVRDSDAVAELVQETFVRAFTTHAREAYDGVRPYRPYLRRIVRNLLVDRARLGGRAVQELDDEALEADDPDPAPDDALAHHRIAAATREFIAGIDEESRTFVRLRFQDEHSQDDVARMMACSRRRVRTLETKIRDALWRHLQRAGLDGEIADVGSPTRRQ